jgi:hypothetical protein
VSLTSVPEPSPRSAPAPAQSHDLEARLAAIETTLAHLTMMVEAAVSLLPVNYVLRWRRVMRGK